MTSRWAAVGADTDQLVRARQLQKRWERLLAGGELGPELSPGATAGLRPTIVESWRRSLATGLDPTDALAPIEAGESDVLERWLEHPLGSLTHVLREQLWNVAEESRSIVVVTDASGLILHRVGDERLKERAAEMNLVEGARYSEAADGTNGIGTALTADHPYQVFAFEHFNERHHDWICSGAPVHDPVSGQTVGLIDLSSLWKDGDPRSLELVTSAARVIEQRLLDGRRDRDARLRRRYSDLMTRSTDVLVDRDGYVLDGAEPSHAQPLDVPEGGGEVVLGDGSTAVAAPIGQGEAYLLRRVARRRAKSGPAEVLDRAEKHVRELVAEQSALRKVATLVARESAPDQLFGAVAEQVARVFSVPHVRLVRYEPGGSVVVGGFSEGDRELFPMGSRWPLDTPGVMSMVRKTGRPARVEDYAHVTGEVAAAARSAGLRSAIGSPIVVERRLWGVMVLFSLQRERFPDDTEARLADFTELIATAIADAETREELARLADEQAALRRVATLVAQGTTPSEIFAAVSSEVDRVFGLDHATSDVSGVVRFEPGSELLVVGVSKSVEAVPLGARFPPDELFAPTHVLRTGHSARISESDLISVGGDVAQFLRDHGYLSQVASPILVEGRIWGAISVNSRDELPPDTEERLEKFTELVATAIANAESREARAVITEEQVALRRVATLVARDAPSAEVFEAVATEVGRLLETDITVVGRYDGDGAATAIGSWSASGEGVPVGTRSAIGGHNVLTIVAETGKPARVEGYEDASGEAAEIARRYGWRSSIAAPIVVEGRVWGVMLVATRRSEPFPAGDEERLAAFTDLVATAVGNTEARHALERVAAEQAALRRVATLVARGAPPQDLFDAVVEEVGRLLLAANVSMGRYEPDDTVTSMASWSADGPVFTPGVRWPIKGTNVAWMVLQTGKPARIDDFSGATDPIGIAVREAGYTSAIGSPIVVEGHLWGAISAASTEGLMPPESEERLASFTELVATAIANAESSEELAASRRRIVAAWDDARRRIERDLHDGVQQQLVSLGLELGTMKVDPPTGDALKEQLAYVTAGVGSVLEALVETARGIHPAILSQGGLAAALRALARRSAVPVELHAQIEAPLPDDVEVAAYFVAAETLTNAAKHAHASVVHTELKSDEGILTLTVRDDGVGGADPSGGSGLVGLQDRVEALGGTITIDSSAGSGTNVVVTLPLTQEPDREVEPFLSLPDEPGPTDPA